MKSEFVAVAILLLATACSPQRRTDASSGDSHEVTDDGSPGADDTGDSSPTGDAGDTGTNGAGASCTNDCGPGDTVCDSPSTVRFCEVGADGCLHWGAPAYCNANETCQDGACDGACTNDCSLGDADCVGNASRRCLAGADGCLHWSSPAACGGGQTCESGQCVASSCQSTCSSPGQIQCNGNTVEQCVTGSDGCRHWGAVSTCGNGTVCLNGACVGGSCGRYADSCSTSSPCCDGYACHGGTCYQCSSAGEGCTVASDCCPGSACRSGVCVAGACQQQDGLCSSASDCCSGLACVSGTCEAQVGDVCATQEDCGYPDSGLMCHGGGTCQAGRCNIQRELCGSTSDCCTGFACDGWTGTCGAPDCGDPGAGCAADSDCCSDADDHLGRCVGGACVWYCPDSGSCPADRTCEAHECVPARPCTSDFDCPSSSMVCSQGYCQPAPY